MFRQIVRNLFSNWAGLLINIVVSFFLAPFVVHKLGNTYYGIWAVVGQFTGYLYLLDFGIRESIIRYASRHRALEERLLDVSGPALARGPDALYVSALVEQLLELRGQREVCLASLPVPQVKPSKVPHRAPHRAQCGEP